LAGGIGFLVRGFLVLFVVRLDLQILVAVHHGAHGLVIIIACVEGGLLPFLRWILLLLFLSVEFLARLLELIPVVIGLFEVLHSVFKLSLFSNQLLNFCQRILSRILLENL
jgi:hypothetical protein